jgi:hypothetical protein
MAPCRKLHLIRSRTESISSRLLPETLSHLHEYHYVRSVRAGPLVDVVAVFSEKKTHGEPSFKRRTSLSLETVSSP